jgi:hypothetical protein
LYTLPTIDPTEIELEVGVVEPSLLGLTTATPVPAPMLFACIKTYNNVNKNTAISNKLFKYLNLLATVEIKHKKYPQSKTAEINSHFK